MQNTRTRPSTQRRHAAASLEFISRVMARSPETSSTTLSIVVTWTVLTLVAVPITLLLIARQIYGLPIFLTWAVHNAVG